MDIETHYHTWGTAAAQVMIDMPGHCHAGAPIFGHPHFSILQADRLSPVHG